MRSDTNCSLALEVSRRGKVSSQRTPPRRVRALRLNEMVHQRNPPSPLSKDEVSYESFAWVRSLESGKNRFAENASPSIENEQVWFTNEVLFGLRVEMRSVISCPLG